MGHEVLFYQRSLGKGNSVHNRVDAERILKFVERFLFIDELPKFGKVQIKTLYNSGRIQICEKALTNTFKCGKTQKSRMVKVHKCSPVATGAQGWVAAATVEPRLSTVEIPRPTRPSPPLGTLRPADCGEGDAPPPPPGAGAGAGGRSTDSFVPFLTGSFPNPNLNSLLAQTESTAATGCFLGPHTHTHTRLVRPQLLHRRRRRRRRRRRQSNICVNRIKYLCNNLNNLAG
jgi:hypothetical protein